VRDTIVSPHLVGDRVYYELWGDHIRVWTGTIDEPAHVLIDVTPAEVRYFETDGTTMTWLQGYDYDWDTLTFARLELWTSPFATRAEELRPRLVHPSFRGLIPMALGGHWLASQGDGPTLDIIDLRDGSRRSWTPPDAGNVADPPLYATENEVLVSTTVGTSASTRTRCRSWSRERDLLGVISLCVRAASTTIGGSRIVRTPLSWASSQPESARVARSTGLVVLGDLPPT
jgi:hypothetical protein